MLRIHEILIRIRRSILLTNGSGSAIFVSDLQDVKKNLLHNFSKIKSHKEVTKQKELKFFLLFLLDDTVERYGSVSGSVSLTTGSGSGRPKNIWILRIQIQIRNTDDDMRPSFSRNIASRG